MRTHRLLLFCAPLALVALALGGCGSGEDASEPMPRAQNVVLVIADTLRADRLGCYGYERDTSPAIDSLAAAGTLYEDCHSQACWTLPSMISLMAGVPVTTKETVLPSPPVLAETLHGAGFATAAFLSNATVGVDRGFERGFDHFGEHFNESAVDVVAGFEAWHASWRASAGPDARFFAWVHFIDPHHPYEPVPEDDVFTGVGPDRARLEPLWRSKSERATELSPEVAGRAIDDAVQGMQDVSNRYDGEVRTVDRGMARLVEALRDADELEQTLIVFASDHGEMLYEQENFPYLVRDRIQSEGGLPDGVMDLFGAGHRPWYYEDLWRTPLIFSGPGFEGGGRRGGLAANLDLYPTILDAVGVARPAWLKGESLFGALEPQRERVFAYGHRTTAVLDRSGAKLVVHLPRMFLAEPGAEPPLELFDLQRDPDERENLAESHRTRTQALLDAIAAWREENEREVIDTTTEAAREAMRGMGYVDDEDE